jgi:hypothetical protein
MRLPAALSLAFLLSLGLASSPALAQSAPETPQPSPKARVEQRVGITDFALDYSSPAVKGRAIWGGLVPYDELWRTGANAATKLTVSRDFTFGGKAVPAGSYSLFTIPGKSSWTVILNGKPDLSGTNGYDEKNDVARVTVTPETLAASRERMTFLFADATESGANLDLEWERMRVRVPVQVDTRKHVMTGIEKSVGDAWRPHFLAARYLLDSNGDLDQALEYANASVSIKPGWWNNWVKAQVLAKKGRKAEAIAAVEQSQQLGKGDNIYEQFFREDIAKAAADWKK